MTWTSFTFGLDKVNMDEIHTNSFTSTSTESKHRSNRITYKMRYKLEENKESGFSNWRQRK